MSDEFDLFGDTSIADLENIKTDTELAIDEKKQAIKSQRASQQLSKEEVREERARLRRRKKAKSNFAYFCKTYMSEAFSLDFSEYQLALTRLASDRMLSPKDEFTLKELIDPIDHGFIVQPISGKYEGVLDIEPRDHGKTTRNTQAMPLWLALNYPKSFIVICGASSTSAEDMMDAVKQDLEDNDLLINDYGIQKVHGNKWAQRKILLPNGSAIACVGRDQPLRGIKNKYQRPTHIICDDLLLDTEVDNPRLRNKAEKWFNRVVLNLGKGALTIVANTILHPDDLPSRLLKRIEAGVLPNWVGFRFSAITPSGRPLFPTRWSLQDLEHKRMTVGAAWWTEWMNRPISDDEADFKSEWLHHYKLHDLDLRDCDIGMAVDSATGLMKGDYSAIAVVARNRITMVDHVLFCNGWKESDLQFARRIVDIYMKYHPTFIEFEDVAFQKIYKKEVLRYAKSRNVRLPIRGFKGGNKEMRIKSLSSEVENGGIQFLESQTLLKQQLLEFPRGHDDLPDALEMCISGFGGSSFIGGATPIREVVRSAAQKLSRLGGGARGRILRQAIADALFPKRPWVLGAA
ncbi:phage terminase large subunit [Enterovibrio nigricans]|nr:phage terminase large subunit [Enterovibrio nigricans]